MSQAGGHVRIGLRGLPMKVRVVFLCVAVVLATGCTDKQSELETEAKEKLAETLKDPESLKVRNLRLITETGSEGGESNVLCGEYDAKNSYGGYSGYEAFAYVEAVNGKRNLFSPSVATNDAERLLAPVLIADLCRGS